jgi:hypothetical protein
VPSQDIVLGLYYLSLETPEFRATGDGDAPAFSGMGEIEQAMAAGAITIHSEEAGGNVHTILYDDIRIEDVIGDAGSTSSQLRGAAPSGP